MKVYVVEVQRFDNLKPDVALEAEFKDRPESYIEWVRENATRIFRGEASTRETFCVDHNRTHGDENKCTAGCTLTDAGHSGWRGLLWSFLNQRAGLGRSLDWRTPVVITDGIRGDYTTDLNHASLMTAEMRNLHKDISDVALGQRDYYENNGDCVDEVPNVYLKEIVSAALDNQYFIAVNEEGTTREAMRSGPGIAVAAETKWRELTERLEHLEEWEGPFYARKYNQSSAEAKIREDFEQWLKQEVKHSTSMFNRAEWFAVQEQPAVPDPRGGTKRGDAKLNDKWLRVCTWQQSTCTDQLSEEIVEAAAALENSSEEFFADVGAALGRQGIEGEGEGENLTIDVDCFWVFAIDVNDAIEKLEDLIAEWRAPSEDE